MHGYVLIGVGTKGKFKGQKVIIGTIHGNSLAQDMEQAEGYLKRAKENISKLLDPDIDPESIEIAMVHPMYNGISL